MILAIGFFLGLIGNIFAGNFSKVLYGVVCTVIFLWLWIRSSTKEERKASRLAKSKSAPKSKKPKSQPQPAPANNSAAGGGFEDVFQNLFGGGSMAAGGPAPRGPNDLKAKAAQAKPGARARQAATPRQAPNNRAGQRHNPTQPRQDRPAGAARQPDPTPARQSPQTPSVSPQDNTLLKSVSSRLRKIAIDYENLAENDLLIIRDGWVERTTAAQFVTGPAALVLRRDGFLVQFINKNSREGKVQNLDRQWRNIIGCLSTDTTLILKDETSVKFTPTLLEDQIVLNAVWFSFHRGMNGDFHLFTEPKTSGFGAMLRAAAIFVEEQPTKILRERKIDMTSATKTVSIVEATATGNVSPVRRLSSPPNVGAMVGSYKLEKQLGESSGFGVVFKSADQVDGQVVAIKFMQQRDKEKFGDPQFHEAANNFLDEAKLSSQYSDNPFLVTAKEWSMDPWPCIVYPLVEGETVSKMLENRNFVGDSWWNLAHDILAGLADLHKDGLVHRDIKFDNVMVMQDRAVILDFGLAHVAGYYKASLQYQFALGFAAPELLKSLMGSELTAEKMQNEVKKLTGAYDVYCAGLTLYQARTGRLPWQQIPRELYSDLGLQYAARAGATLDHEKFTPEEFILVSSMLDLNPELRIQARSALQLIAPNVDVESKTRLFEEISLRGSIAKASEPRQHDETQESYEIAGPFKSWTEFSSAIRDLTETRRPRFFSVDINFRDGRELLYCQAYNTKPDWSLECMSEKFMDKALHASVKNGFMNLGWSPPAGESPNFQRNLEQSQTARMASIFVDAFTQGYSIQPSEIASFRIQLVGSGHY